MRPRRLAGLGARPLNFTVRSHLGETQRREELGGCFGWLCGLRALTDPVVLWASSLGATDVRVRLLGALNSRGLIGFGCRRGAARAQWCSVRVTSNNRSRGP